MLRCAMLEKGQRPQTFYLLSFLVPVWILNIWDGDWSLHFFFLLNGCVGLVSSKDRV